MRWLSQSTATLALCFASPWLAVAPQLAQAQSCNVGGVQVACVDKIPGTWEVGQSIHGINSNHSVNSTYKLDGDIGAVVAAYLSQLTSSGPPLMISSSLIYGLNPIPPLDPVGLIAQSSSNSGSRETLTVATSYGGFMTSMVAYPYLPPSGPGSPASGGLNAARNWSCPKGYEAISNPGADPALANKCIKAQVCSTDKPVDPLSGLKRQTVVDYQGAGAHPLSFTRTYTSNLDSSGLAYSGFAKTQADSYGVLPGSGFDASNAQHWQHNYSSLVWFNAFSGGNTPCPGTPPTNGYSWDIKAGTAVRRNNGEIFYFSLVPGSLLGQCVDRTQPVSGVTRTVSLTSSQTRDTLIVTLDSHHQPISAAYRVFETDQIERYSTSTTPFKPTAGSTIARLQSITERNGWVTTLAYSTADTPQRDFIEGSASVTGSEPTKYLLISATNAFGRQLRFAYNAEGNLTQLLPPGAVKDSAAGAATSPIRYAYRAAGAGHAVNSLERVTWQDGTNKQYHYEAVNNPSYAAGSTPLLTGITDEAGVRTDTYRYDSRGRIVEEYGAPGADGVRSYHLSFGYTIYAESQTTVTDHVARNAAGQVQANNRSYRFARVAAGSGGTAPSVYATTLTAPCSVCGGTGALTINGPYNQPIKAVAHDGSVTFTTYDTKGRATEVATFPASQSGAWPRPALSLATSVVSTQWHASWNLPVKVAQSNGITAYTYNGKGMVTGEATTPTTDLTGALKFAGARDIAQPIPSTGFSYSAANLPTVKLVKSNGVQTARWTYTWTLGGTVNKLSDAAGGSITATSVLADGNVTAAKIADGTVIATQYDVRGRMTKQALGANQWISWGRNATGDVNRVQTHAGFDAAMVYDATGDFSSISANGQSIFSKRSKPRLDSLDKSEATPPSGNSMWAQTELGVTGNLFIGGVSMNTGVMVNASTREVCPYVTICPRVALGFLGNVGIKGGVQSGPRCGKGWNGPGWNTNAVGDVATPGLNIGGNIGVGDNSITGIGAGIGPGWGLGFAVGLEFCSMYVNPKACKNTPCECKGKK